MDSDDYIGNKMFEKMLSTLKTNNADIVECGTIYCDEEGNYIKKILKIRLKFMKKIFK